MNVVIRAQIIDQECRMPGRAYVAKKVDWGFNKQGHIRMGPRPWQKQKKKKDAPNSRHSRKKRHRMLLMSRITDRIQQGATA
jgi:hypothetical protein